MPNEIVRKRMVVGAWSRSGVMMSAAVVYKFAGVNFSQIGWMIASPNDKYRGAISTDTLIENCLDRCQEMGCRMVKAECSSRLLQKRLSDSGFIIGDENINSYFIKI
mgnify:CR=1 FL=1